MQICHFLGFHVGTTCWNNILVAGKFVIFMAFLAITSAADNQTKTEEKTGTFLETMFNGYSVIERSGLLIILVAAALVLSEMYYLNTNQRLSGIDVKLDGQRTPDLDEQILPKRFKRSSENGKVDNSN